MATARDAPLWRQIQALLARRGEQFEPARKISNADLYQLFFYQQRLQRKFNLPAPPVAVFAAPLPEDDEMNGNSPIPERFRLVVWQAGPDRAGDVRLFLIP